MIIEPEPWPENLSRCAAGQSRSQRQRLQFLRRRVGGSRLPLLEIALLAAIEAVLAGLDFFFALRSYSNPVLYRGVPVQIAVLDDLAHFEKSRVIGRGWLCLVCRAHAAL